MSIEEPTLYQVEDGWIEVISGRQIHFAARPRILAREIFAEDIAYSLARLCRYNGHCKRFYSVAEHCLIMEKAAEKMGLSITQRLTILHHDDAEYLIGDLARPIKEKMPEFKALELKIDHAVAIRFGTFYPMPAWLKSMDARILKDERSEVMNPSNNNWGIDNLDKLGVKFMWFAGRFPWLIEKRWLAKHRQLTQKRLAEG